MTSKSKKRAEMRIRHEQFMAEEKARGLEAQGKAKAAAEHNKKAKAKAAHQRLLARQEQAAREERIKAAKRLLEGSKKSS